VSVLPVFPAAVRGLTWTVLKRPRWPVISQESPSGNVTSVVQAYNPLWEWTLIYDYLKDNPDDLVSSLSPYTDLQYLMGFFMSLQGSFGSFLYSDPTDNHVGPALISAAPNTAAQLAVVNDDGGNYYSPVQRNMGGQFAEDITDLNGSITVYANGVLQTEGTDYTVIGPGVAINGYSWTGLVLQWAASPATPVTAEFHFYFRVQWSADEQDFEQFMGLLWTIGGSESKNGSGTLKFKTRRPPNTA
jgi:hypothetical protein